MANCSLQASTLDFIVVVWTHSGRGARHLLSVPGSMMNCFNYDHNIWVTVCIKHWRPTSKLVLEDCRMWLAGLPTHEDYSSYSKEKSNTIMSKWNIACSGAYLLESRWFFVGNKIWFCCFHARTFILFNKASGSCFRIQTFTLIGQSNVLALTPCKEIQGKHIFSEYQSDGLYLCNSTMCRSTWADPDLFQFVLFWLQWAIMPPTHTHAHARTCMHTCTHN